MNDELNGKTQLRAYLFGELEETVAEQLEERFFTEPVWLEVLQAERDDLLDEWASGELSAFEAEKLEARLAELPALRERAEFARSLHQHLAKPAEPQAAPLSWQAWQVRLAQLFAWENRWQLAAAATVGLALGGWSVWNALHSRPTPSPKIAQQPSVTPETKALSPNELAAVREKTKPAVRQTTEQNLKEPEVASFVLASSVLRGAGDTAPALALPVSAKILRLQLELPSEDFKPQRAVLQNAAGETLWQQRRLPVRQAGSARYVVCEVSVKLLAEGSYQWRIAPANGAEAIYPFTPKKSQADQ